MRSWQIVPLVLRIRCRAEFLSSLVLDSFRLALWFSGVLLVASLSLLVMSTAADTIRLTPKGAAALQGTGLTVLSADGKTYVVHGQFVVARDDTDQLTLKFPGKYFLFRPFKKGSAGGGKVEQFEWAWFAGANGDIDTLEELRDLISNRDKRYGGWRQGLQALLADLDPQGSLGLKKGTAPPVINDKIVPREGWLTRDFLQGLPTPAQFMEMIRAAQALPPEDPQSSTRIALTRSGSPMDVVRSLLSAIARAQKYGEPEPGFLQAALAIAQFLTGSLDTDPYKAKGDDEERAKRIYLFVEDFTHTLVSTVDACSAEAIGGGTYSTASAERLSLYLKPLGGHDDDRPIDCFDTDLAGVGALGGPQVSRPKDDELTVDALLHSAEGRRDFLDPDMRAVCPPDLQARLDTTGKLAFETLVRIAGPPALGQPDLGFRFRGGIPSRVFKDVGDPRNGHSHYPKSPSAVLAQVGAGNAEEASKLPGFFLNPFTKDNSSGGILCDSKKIDLGIDTIRGMMSGTKNTAIKVIFERDVELRMNFFQDRVRAGAAGYCDGFLVDHWKSRP
jgi:hypothetical protein